MGEKEYREGTQPKPLHISESSQEINEEIGGKQFGTMHVVSNFPHTSKSYLFGFC